jgi:hypothetical protein
MFSCNRCGLQRNFVPHASNAVKWIGKKDGMMNTILMPSIPMWKCGGCGYIQFSPATRLCGDVTLVAKVPHHIEEIEFEDAAGYILKEM